MKYISLYRLFRMNTFFWIKSFTTLRDLVIEDINNDNILEVEVKNKNSTTGIRYLIPVKNIDKFINSLKLKK